MDAVAGRDAAAATDTTVADGGAPTRAARGFWRTHVVFSVLLIVAFGLRIAAMLGFRWALWFNDSYEYVGAALHLQPHHIRPSGYSILLWLLMPLHSFALVVLIQHLMGLACGVLIYAVLRHRYRLPGWGASLAAVPALFDAYQIALEHLVLSDTMFGFLVVCAVTVALWHRTISVRRGIAVGLLLAAAALTRSVGLPLLAVFIVYFLVRRIGWRPLLATMAACALPMIAYATWFMSMHGQFALTNSSGTFLYVRVMSFANCKKIDPPVDELPLCTATPPADRPVPQFYLWGRVSPLHRIPMESFSPEQSTLTGDFAKRAILAQPLDYLHDVGASALRTFYWTHPVYPDATTYAMYQFPTDEQPLPDWQIKGSGTAAGDARSYEHGRASTNIVEPFAGFLRWYQQYFFLRGTVLGAILLIGAVGAVLRWRRWGGSVLLPLGVGCALLLAPPATTDFDYRYVLPAVPLLCLAAAVAVGRIRLRGRSRSAEARTDAALDDTTDVSTRARERAGTGSARPGRSAQEPDAPTGRSSETATA